MKFFICKKFGKYSISRIFQLFCFYYFTFTIITFFFPSLVFTVILHLPFFNALITPFFVTLAIFLLEERYIILAVEDAGIFLASILYFFPFFKVTFVFFTFKDFVFIVFLTVEPEAGFVSDFFSEAAGFVSGLSSDIPGFVSDLSSDVPGFVFELFPESPGLLLGLSSELPGFVTIEFLRIHLFNF